MRILTAAAGLAAVLVSAGAAMAVPVSGTPVPRPIPTNEHRGQFASNRNLRTASRHVERAIDQLSRDASDYGGHKERAIDDLSAARQDLNQALAFWQSRHNERGATAQPFSTNRVSDLPIGNPGTVSESGANSVDEFHRGQPGSNENIQDVRKHVERAIDALNSDASDFGGFKEKAIDRLSAARAQLDAALDFVHSPGVQNGGKGQRVSDANLKFVDGHIQAAVARLQQDRHDYGGHRVAAIDDLQQAEADIRSALSFDAAHGNSAATTNGTLPIGNPVGTHPLPQQPPPRGVVGGIGQGASNESLADARRNVETAIDALQRDAHDYGGFREKALDRLQAARVELITALNFQRTK